MPRPGALFATVAAAVLGGKGFRIAAEHRRLYTNALFIFVQQLPHLLNGQGRILPIERFLTFPLLPKWMLVAEAAAGDRVVRIVTVTNGRRAERRARVCNPILEGIGRPLRIIE